jgi:hypothetical protein
MTACCAKNTSNASPQFTETAKQLISKWSPKRFTFKLREKLINLMTFMLSHDGFFANSLEKNSELIEIDSSRLRKQRNDQDFIELNHCELLLFGCLYWPFPFVALSKLAVKFAHAIFNLL